MISFKDKILFESELDKKEINYYVENEYFGDKVYETYIKRNVRLGEAPSHGKPILLYDATSTGAHNYMNLVAEFLNNNG